MTGNDRHRSELPLRLLLISSFVIASVALVVAFDRTAATDSVAAQESLLAQPHEPIAAEARVFQTDPAMFAVEPSDQRHRSAHPRTLQTWRALREYPGAPPRIPHGFTTDEFRTGACNTCHERGGYSPRFGAYVPVTPHPEMSACLQCHVGDDAVTGVTLPTADPSARCRQCHALSGQRSTTPGLDWRAAEWPRLAARPLDRPPPAIPHVLDFRGNCLACHAGPAAVAEIRTQHPERANCRQCHVRHDLDATSFVRPATTGDPDGGPA